jgi:hypothetical protein
VLAQHLLAKRLALAERDGLETTRALQAEREAANAGKKVKHLQHHASPQKAGGRD